MLFNFKLWTVSYRSKRITEMPRHIGLISSKMLVLALMGSMALSCSAHTPTVLAGYNSNVGVAGQVRQRPHDGVDIAAQVGNAVIASADGAVSWVYSSASSGTTVTIYSPALQYWISYSHLKSSSVFKGRRIHRGEKIGEIGMFPDSGGISHVHWRLCRDEGCKSTSNPLDLKPGCSYVSPVLFPIKC
jgi:murein DD-endopeptidase MepM/ murein hydrolase activator NlpD